MKKSFLKAIVLVVCLSGWSYSQSGGMGVGVIVGEPTGLMLKTWSTQTTALEFAFAYSLVGDNLYGHADYLLHNYSLISNQMPVFYGIGAYLIAHEKPGFGIRVPLGLAFYLDGAPLDIFAQLAPAISILPGTAFDLLGGLGIRYYF